MAKASGPQRPRRRFGRVRKLPSGRYQAGYLAPDGSVIYAETASPFRSTFLPGQGSRDIGATRDPSSVQCGATWCNLPASTPSTPAIPMVLTRLTLRSSR